MDIFDKGTLKAPAVKRKSAQEKTEDELLVPNLILTIKPLRKKWAWLSAILVSRWGAERERDLIVVRIANAALIIIMEFIPLLRLRKNAMRDCSSSEELPLERRNKLKENIKLL